MRFSIAALLAICFASTQAFKNTSPFFLFSTTENLAPKDEIKQLQSNNNMLQTALEALSSCPSKHYVLVEQENVNIDDFTSERAAPFLKRAMKDERIKSVLSVEEVVGQSVANVIQKHLEAHCSADREFYNETKESFEERLSYSEKRIVTRLNFNDLPSAKAERSALLADYDYFLSTILAKIPQDSYTIIYTTTPISAETQVTYESTFQDPLHVELKRQTDLIRLAPERNLTKGLPLFEKYQFLSPGIFMGILTVLILLAILGVGIGAIASLQVSYGAFDKEMGPAAGKKQ